ncbi:MAG: hypothetical protein GKR89_22355 [Candidatus Latescibacteria bacterium]|nr:hypothetical protein [Candidatus Latescibacterota bacterium]
MKHLLSFFAAFLLVAPPLCSAQSEEHAGTIVFASYRTGMNQIYSMDANGENEVQLTDNPSGATGPVVSPRGHRVAFKNSVNAPEPTLSIMAIDGSKGVDLVQLKSQMQDIAWSPDGTAFAYNAISEEGDIIWVRNVDGGALNDLSKLSYQGGGSDHHPSWGPSLISTPTLIEKAAWGQLKATRLPLKEPKPWYR